MLKKQKHPLIKSLEDEVEKIGPLKCLTYGSILGVLSYYIRYYQGGSELLDGNYWSAVKHFLTGLPVGAASDILLVGGGYVEGKKILKKIKNKFYKD